MKLSNRVPGLVAYLSVAILCVVWTATVASQWTPIWSGAGLFGLTAAWGLQKNQRRARRRSFLRQRTEQAGERRQLDLLARHV